MEGGEWLAAVKLLGAALGVIMLGLAGWLKGKTSSPKREIEGEVVAATFTERAVMERLIAAVNRLCTLLEAEVHEREVTKAVRDELDRRGK